MSGLKNSAERAPLKGLREVLVTFNVGFCPFNLSITISIAIIQRRYDGQEYNRGRRGGCHAVVSVLNEVLVC